jgi:uncharacterized membrane protein
MPHNKISEDEKKVQAALLSEQNSFTDLTRALLRFGTAIAVIVAIGYLLSH